MIIKTCKHILFSVFAVIVMAAAGDSYHEFCEEARVMLASKKKTDVYNNIDKLKILGATSQGETLSTVLFVNAVLSYTAYDKWLDMAALSDSARLSEAILAQKDVQGCLWQKKVASLMLAIVRSTEGRYVQAHEICKSALAGRVSEPRSEDDLRLWNAFCKRHLVADLSVEQALNFYAAMTLLMQDPKAECSAYVKDLPDEAIGCIKLVSGHK